MSEKLNYFGPGEDWTLNACVGRNGTPGIQNFAAGFALGAQKICEAISKDQFRHNVDLLIYPILFSARHSLELYLKHFLDCLKEMRPEYFNPINNKSQHHDLKILWEEFKMISVKADRRLKDEIDKINGFVSEMAKIDPNEQTFRYPFSLDNIRHLEDVQIINIGKFFEHFSEVQDHLKFINSFMAGLIDEYKTRTFLKNLSRNDIKEISKILPSTAHWNDNEFDRVRDSIKEKYSIGYKELSDAINLIKTHREFSSNIGIEIPLKYAKKDKFIKFSKLVSTMNSTCDAFDCFSIDELVDFATIFDIGRQNLFAEEYDMIFNFFKSDFESDFSGQLAWLTSKANFVDCSRIGLKILGQKTILYDLIEIFGYEEKIDCT